MGRHRPPREGELLLAELRPDHVEHGGEQLRNVDRRDAQLDPSRAQLREVEHVAHEAVEVVLAPLDPAKVDELLLGHGATHAELDELRVAADRIQRRTQLVTHRREELALGAIRLLRLLRQALELGLRALRVLDVGVRPEPADHAPAVVTLRGRPAEMPPVRPVCSAPEPELHLVRLARAQRPLPARDRRRDVGRM